MITDPSFIGSKQFFLITLQSKKQTIHCQTKMATLSENASTIRH
jgi:hypothetical protein